MDKKNRTELLCLSPKKTNNNRFKLIYHFDFFLQKQPELGATGEMSLGGEWRGGGGGEYFKAWLQFGFGLPQQVIASLLEFAE